VKVWEAIEVDRPLEEVFAYLADMSNSAQWDPGIAEAVRLGERPVGPGTEFDLVALFRGKRVPMRYRVAAYDEGRRVVFDGEGEKARSLDEITVEPARDGTRITYVADLRMKGAYRLLEPFLRGTFRRIGEDALAGLKATLGEPR
jgi:carbon monoxide dehydrogenase subunit G